MTNANNDIIATNVFDSITIGLTQQFSPQWRGTAGYGYMKADDNDAYVNAFADKTKINKDLWQAWANVFYSPVKPVSLGLEYVYGEREAFGAAASSVHHRRRKPHQRCRAVQFLALNQLHFKA